MNEQDKYFIQKAIELAEKSVDSGLGGPFGAVVVKDGTIIGEGHNSVTSSNDPTAHAEMVAIREACKNLNSFQLKDCVIYTSCEPCPMCLGAIYWARPEKVFFAGTKEDAAEYGFDDRFIYDEIARDIRDRKIKFENINRNNALHVFKKWRDKSDKTEY